MALHCVLLHPRLRADTVVKVSKYIFREEVNAEIKAAADLASEWHHQLRAAILGVQRMHADGLSELSGHCAFDGHGRRLMKAMMWTSSLRLPGHSTR